MALYVVIHVYYFSLLHCLCFGRIVCENTMISTPFPSPFFISIHRESLKVVSGFVCLFVYLWKGSSVGELCIYFPLFTSVFDSISENTFFFLNVTEDNVLSHFKLLNYIPVFSGVIHTFLVTNKKETES